MASPTFQTAATQFNAAGTSYIGTAPTGTATGDLLVAQIEIRINVSTTMSTVPTGWTVIRTNDVGVSDSQVWWKLATGSDTAGTTYTWVGDQSQRSGVHISRISGQDATTPINTHNGAAEGAGTTSHSMPTVTTTVADTLIFYFATGLVNTTGTVTSPVVEAYDANSGVAGAGAFWGYGAREPQAAVGTSTARTVTSAASATSVNQTVAIAPAGAAATSLIIPTDTVYRILSRR